MVLISNLNFGASRGPEWPTSWPTVLRSIRLHGTTEQSLIPHRGQRWKGSVGVRRTRKQIFGVTDWHPTAQEPIVVTLARRGRSLLWPNSGRQCRSIRATASGRLLPRMIRCSVVCFDRSLAYFPVMGK